MGIDYSFYLRVGYILDEDEVHAPFRRANHIKEEGVFHLEKRFDPKTGVEVEPTKVWDKKPKDYREHWYEVDGEKLHDLYPDLLEKFFKKKFDCKVDWTGNCCSGEHQYVFYTHESGNEYLDEGRVTVSNVSMDFDYVKSLEISLKKLKLDLETFGYKVGEPKVFIAHSIG